MNIPPRFWHLLAPARIPEWLCLCGARNRLRDHTCRNCGAPRP